MHLNLKVANCQNPMKRRSAPKILAIIGVNMSKKPYNNLLLDHIDGFEFSGSKL